MLSVTMLSVIYAERHYAEYLYAECHCAKCLAVDSHGARKIVYNIELSNAFEMKS